MDSTRNVQVNYDVLRLESQLCFPLYACAREVIKRYKPFLDEIGLTYTQYITMMVLWEENTVSSKRIGERLFLDSGTLTPVLKKLEAMGFVRRSRDTADERNLIVSLTAEGEALKDCAVSIPPRLGACIPITEGDALELYNLLYRVLDSIKAE